MKQRVPPLPVEYSCGHRGEVEPWLVHAVALLHSAGGPVSAAGILFVQGELRDTAARALCPACEQALHLPAETDPDYPDVARLLGAAEEALRLVESPRVVALIARYPLLMAQLRGLAARLLTRAVEIVAQSRASIEARLDAVAPFYEDEEHDSVAE